jgi:hypothetical protein
VADEIDAVLKSGNTAESVITASILKGSNEAIKNVYQNVASKYEASLWADIRASLPQSRAATLSVGCDDEAHPAGHS